MEKLFFDSAKMDWENLGGGVSRQIMGYDGKIMLVKVKFETNGIGKLHQHEHSQTSYVAAGIFEVTIGNEMQILREGDSFFVPANVLHGVHCLAAGVLVDNFSPAREDFLK